MFYGAAFIISAALTLFALLDVIATESSMCRNLPKNLWLLLVLLVPTMGPLAWLIMGRPEKTRFRPGDTRYRSTGHPSRPLGPDDDPRFLEMTRKRNLPPPSPKEPVKPAEAEPAEPVEPAAPVEPAGAAGFEGAGLFGAAELKAWEEDLRRREEQLRKDDEGNPS